MSVTVTINCVSLINGDVINIEVPFKAVSDVAKMSNSTTLTGFKGLNARGNEVIIVIDEDGNKIVNAFDHCDFGKNCKNLKHCRGLNHTLNIHCQKAGEALCNCTKYPRHPVYYKVFKAGEEVPTGTNIVPCAPKTYLCTNPFACGLEDCEHLHFGKLDRCFLESKNSPCPKLLNGTCAIPLEKHRYAEGILSSGSVVKIADFGIEVKKVENGVCKYKRCTNPKCKRDHPLGKVEVVASVEPEVVAKVSKPKVATKAKAKPEVKKICNFDGRCNKPDCKFDHPSGKAEAKAKVVAKLPFPCRHGNDCNRKETCKFTH